MEFFIATGKLIFFLQLEMFDVCTTGDTAHIDTIFKFLPHTRHQGGTCQKKKFSFLVAVNNSIKVGPLVSLL